jgi:8-oxo-dGTP pyrophosphatase MutT (NUDIX family)
VIDESSRLLLLQGRDRSTGHCWWVAPGGGLQEGESFEEAAFREVKEETGLALQIGEWVWTRHHEFEWEGRQFSQYERYFVARAAQASIVPIAADSYIIGHRWWSAADIQNSTEDFAPRRLGALFPNIIAGKYPPIPIDCGV